MVLQERLSPTISAIIRACNRSSDGIQTKLFTAIGENLNSLPQNVTANMERRKQIKNHDFHGHQCDFCHILTFRFICMIQFNP